MFDYGYRLDGNSIPGTTVLVRELGDSVSSILKLFSFLVFNRRFIFTWEYTDFACSLFVGMTVKTSS